MTTEEDEGADAPLQAMPDVSDLKTYDVPDPIEARGSFFRACGLSIVGLVLALGFLHFERGPHYFWIFENDRWEWNRDSARQFISELPASEVLERVLKIEDLQMRGAFHKVLAETGEEVHVAAIVAYIEGQTGYQVESDVADVVESLQAFGPPAFAKPLFAVTTNSRANDDVVRALRKHLDELPPELIAEPVLAIEDLAKRGSWHKVLASTGDPAQIEAIFAYVETSGASEDRRFDEEAKSLLAFGEAGTDKLKAALHSQSRTTINLAAEALRDVNLPFLIKYCRKQLDEYESGIFGDDGLRLAAILNEAWKRQNELGANVPPEDRVTAEANTKAELTLVKFEQHSLRIMEMLKAMQPVPNNEGVDFCFAQGLSSFSPPVAQYCAATLQERLTPDKLIDVMFRFIAKKDQFSVPEVDIYENMLLATGAAGGARIVINLKRLLDEQKGDPSEVFWISKKMALAVLAKTGTASAVPTLELYLEDVNSYYATETKLGQTTRTEIKFTTQCQQTIDTIKRSGR